MKKQSWIEFALSLFPGARNMTKEEQDAFNKMRKKKFKTFRMGIKGKLDRKELYDDR